MGPTISMLVCQENTKLKIEIARQKKQKDRHPDFENSLAAANGKI